MKRLYRNYFEGSLRKLGQKYIHTRIFCSLLTVGPSVGPPSPRACSLLTVWCLSALSWTPIAPGVQPAHRVVPVGPQLDPHRPGRAACSPCGACRPSVGPPSPRACSLLTVWCLSALSWTPIAPGVQPAHRVVPVGPQLDAHRPGRAACSPCGACRPSVGPPSPRACSLLTVWCLPALSWTPIAPGVQPAHRVVPVGPQLDPHRPGRAACSPCGACRPSVGPPSLRACSLLTVWCLSALSWTPIAPGVQPAHRVMPVGPQLDPHRPGRAACSPFFACRPSVGPPSPRACSLLTV